jgi:hypothetical protein
MLKEVFTLGFYVAPDEKSAPLVFPEVGIFSAEDFDPEDWKASFRVMPFDNMTREDAFWATRIILSFTDDELLGIVKTAEYSNPRVADYIFRTLLERRRLIAARWLEDVNPLADFAVETANNGIALKFNDLLVDHDLAGRAEYRYEVTSKQTPNGNHRTEKKAASASRIPLEGALGDAIQVRIWTIRENHSAAPVTVYLHPRPEGRYGIFRIERT